MASLSGMQPQPAPSRPVIYGAVGRSLRVASLEPATGALDWRGAVDLPRGDVQYAAMHPGRKYLYVSATDRAATNLIYAFSIEARTGALTPLGEPFELPASLSRAVHITVDGSGKYLLTAHNVTETVAVLSLAPDGRVSALIPQPEMPKLGYLVHQIRIDPANTTVFVPVRGNDAQPAAAEQPGRLHVFAFSEGVLRLRQTIDYESGIGPRHLDFHPTQPWVYVLAERGNVLITYRRDGPAMKELFRTTTLRDTSFKFPAQRAGAIHVHPNGRWLYATNRNVAPCASSVPCPDRQTKPFGAGENNVALFSIDPATGRPTLVEHTDSRGFEPRTFTLDPSGSFLIAGNMMNIARKGEDGRITDVEPNLSIFRIGPDGRLQFVRSYEQAGAGLLWWVGAYVL